MANLGYFSPMMTSFRTMLCNVFNRGLLHYDALFHITPDNHVELSSVCLWCFGYFGFDTGLLLKNALCHWDLVLADVTFQTRCDFPKSQQLHWEDVNLHRTMGLSHLACTSMENREFKPSSLPACLPAKVLHPAKHRVH